MASSGRASFRDFRNCTMARHEVRKVSRTHNSASPRAQCAPGREWRGAGEKSYGNEPHIGSPSIYASLSSSLRPTFVVQLTPMLLHNNSLFTAGGAVYTRRLYALQPAAADIPCAVASFCQWSFSSFFLCL